MKLLTDRTTILRKLSFETLEARTLLVGDGLVGEYFESTDLTTPAGTRTDAVVNFPNDVLGNDAQGMVIADDEYSIRWTGWVRIDQVGLWQFTTYSNDGVRLWVDNTQLIENWTFHTSQRDDGQIQLSAGWHTIRMEYFQSNGSTDARLLFSGPGQSEVIIPQSHLSTTDPNTGNPVADAGPDLIVPVPAGSPTLRGSATDNGTIISYAWTQLSGPNAAVMSYANTENLVVGGLIQGTYEFQLTVTDDELNTANCGSWRWADASGDRRGAMTCTAVSSSSRSHRLTSASWIIESFLAGKIPVAMQTPS